MLQWTFYLISSRNFEMKENNKIKHFNRILGRFDMIRYKCAWIIVKIE